MTDIVEFLFNNKDVKYDCFQSALIPTVSSDTTIGVRTPVLKKYAKELIITDKYKAFLSELPHKYFEENQLHAFILSELKEYDKTLILVDEFLPYVDNWATCDQLIPKSFKKNADILLPQIKRWINYTHTYTGRFGIGMLMKHFLDDRFNTEYLTMVANVHSNEYYVNMMAAWFFATALTQKYDDTLPYFQDKLLDKWVHNKSISKACDSCRVPDEHKEYLKSLRIK